MRPQNKYEEIIKDLESNLLKKYPNWSSPRITKLIQNHLEGAPLRTDTDWNKSELDDLDEKFNKLKWPLDKLESHFERKKCNICNQLKRLGFFTLN